MSRVVTFWKRTQRSWRTFYFFSFSIIEFSASREQKNPVSIFSGSWFSVLPLGFRRLNMNHVKQDFFFFFWREVKEGWGEEAGSFLRGVVWFSLTLRGFSFVKFSEFVFVYLLWRFFCIFFFSRLFLFISYYFLVCPFEK